MTPVEQEFVDAHRALFKARRIGISFHIGEARERLSRAICAMNEQFATEIEATLKSTVDEH